MNEAPTSRICSGNVPCRLPTWLMAFCVGIACMALVPCAIAKKAQPDPRELIGKEIIGTLYPNGWKGIGNPFSSRAYSLDGMTLYKGHTRAFVLQKVISPGQGSTPGRYVVADAVKIDVNPYKRGQLFVRDCKHPEVVLLNDDKIIFSEARFKFCERYSSRVSNAWLVDMKAQKISPISPKGMRCEDTFFNNGPDGPTCPPIAKEW